MPNRYVKDPSARLEYTWDWVDWLREVTDTIDTATLIIPEGLTAVEEPAIGPTAVTQRVEGGALNDTYRMICQITTAGGLIDKRSIYLTIADQ